LVTPENIISWFRKAGIYPYNRDAISNVGSTTQQTKRETATQQK